MRLTKQQKALLINFYSYKRPHASDSEKQFIDAFIMPAVKQYPDLWFIDAVGNIHLDLRQTEENRTLFVAHTDSVHKEAGRQTPIIKNNKMQLPSPKNGANNSNCLGADDASGILILLQLIKHNTPAYYIFTRAEERGGIGAQHVAKTYEDLLFEFDRAVAFDRRGTHSVITHQAFGRTCSEEFAEALSDALSDDVLMYCPDNTGVYTDTAEFLYHIPECTNVSVGYANEHTANETQDIEHLLRLMDAVLTVDWDNLPTQRDPALDDEFEDYKDMFSNTYAKYDIYDKYSTSGYDWFDRDEYYQ